MNRLEQIIYWSDHKTQCELCKFSDNYEDMAEVERDGEKAIVHRECLADQKVEGSERDNHNNDSNFEVEQ